MKVLSVLAGIVLTVVLYLGLAYLSHLYSNGSSQWGGGVWIGFAVVIPVLIFAGSMLTGFLIEPSLEKSSFAFVFYSPGIFFVGVLICSAFLTGSGITMLDLIVCGGICLIWLLSSCLGVALGYKLRAWI